MTVDWWYIKCTAIASAGARSKHASTQPFKIRKHRQNGMQSNRILHLCLLLERLLVKFERDWGVRLPVKALPWLRSLAISRYVQSPAQHRNVTILRSNILGGHPARQCWTASPPQRFG